MMWYKKSSDQGNAPAQNAIAVLHYYGNFTKALMWFKKAADQGYALAQNNIGHLYYHGKGVPQDTTKATEWYIKSRVNGYKSPLIKIDKGILLDTHIELHKEKEELQEKHNKLQKEICVIKRKLLEMELRPPSQGGDMFIEANKRFDEAIATENINKN